MARIDIEPFVRYVEKERDILQIRALLNLSYDACSELYTMMIDECKSWAEITPYQFESIWEPARECYKTLMVFGEWKYSVWEKAVAGMVHNFQFTGKWDFQLNWDEIGEIEW